MIMTHWEVIGQYPLDRSTCYPLGATSLAMQTVHDTRRQRLAMLLDQYKTFANLNDALKWPRTDGRLSRIKNQNVRTDREGKSFEMGDSIAREMEEKLGLDHGWMDTPPSYAELHGDPDPRTHLLAVMEKLPVDQYATAIRLITALAGQDPTKNGTQH